MRAQEAWGFGDLRLLVAVSGDKCLLETLEVSSFLASHCQSTRSYVTQPLDTVTALLLPLKIYLFFYLCVCVCLHEFMCTML